MSNRTAFLLRNDASLAVYQRPDEKLDYALDYSALVSDGDAITSSAWTATGDVVLSAESQSGAVVSAWVAGAGGVVTNAVETAMGRKRVVSFCVIAPPAAACV